MTRGRHTPGRHAAGRKLTDEPWARSSEHGVWKAYKNGLELTVTHLAGGSWQAEAEGPGVSERSDAFATRLAAQEWCDRLAGETGRPA